MRCSRQLAGCVLALPLMAAGCEEATALDEPVGVTTGALSRARPNAPAVPPELEVPRGHVLSFVHEAEGVQVYACTEGEADDDAPTWEFERPDALLFGAWGRVVAQHYEGPTWEGLDRSFVAGGLAVRHEVDGAIPWLRLTATGFGGEGMFSNVTYIQRLDTEQGLAPGVNCEVDHIGARVRVPYTATYYFYTSAANSVRARHR
jgi:hypothetical protein